MRQSDNDMGAGSVRMRMPMQATVLLLLLLALFAIGPAGAFEPNKCPPGWEAALSRCYLYSGDDDKDTWANGLTRCVDDGGSLASIHNDEENQFIHTSYCRDNGAGSVRRGTGVCWLGLYQIQGQNFDDFQWINSDPYRDDAGEIIFDNWAPGEPNNLERDDVDDTRDGEDCTQIWNRAGSESMWNDEPCLFRYPYVCTQEALCRKGAYESTPYENWLGVKADCTDCPGGTFRSTTGAKSVEDCASCAAGTVSSAGRRSACSVPCAQGFYCPSGTDADAAVNSGNGPKTCPAGKFGGSTGLGAAEDCGECNPGFFCAGTGETRPDPPGSLCGVGRCGFLSQTASGCNQKCPAGFLCAAGTACPGALNNDGSAPINGAVPCGSPDLFCPEGLGRIGVSPGFYSTGGSSPETRTGQSVCEPGYYCQGGERIACPGGSYRATSGASSVAACLPCDAGYVCPDGQPSSSARAVSCFDATFLAAFPAFDGLAAEALFCPASSSLPTVASAGFYTVPLGAVFRNNREAQTACVAGEVCVEGVLSPLLAFTGGSACALTGTDEVDVDEAAAPGVVATVVAGINPQASGAFTVQYTLADFQYHDASVTACDPVDLATNGGGMFTYGGSGQFRLAQPGLNFEVCLPIVDVQYVATLSAEAVRTSDGAVVSSLECALTVTVVDLNDEPEFFDFNSGDGSTAATTVYYRQILEGVDKNVPVSVCDSTGVLFGCPAEADTIDSSPELLARDEDDGSVLTYSITSALDGATPASARPFKIDPCTGLVSARTSGGIAFDSALGEVKFEYIVEVTDDGNGGEHPVITDQAKLEIYVINVNDAPAFLPVVGAITIQEGQDAEQPTSQMPSAEDPDLDALNYVLTVNDGGAFEIVDNVLRTTRVGADTINFESSKKEYFLEIQVDDGRGGIAVGSFTVAVTNANDPPSFDDSVSTFYVLENVPGGTLVCANPEGDCEAACGGVPGCVQAVPVTTTDEDNLVADGTTYSTTSSVFNIGPTSGLITTSGVPLDFEDEATDLGSGTGRGYIIEVTAVSSGGGTGDATLAPSTTSVTVYVVDANEPPACVAPFGPFSVPEFWPVGRVLPIAIGAEDPDNSDLILLSTFAPQQSLSYSNNGANAFFSVTTNPDTRAAEIVVSSPLNFEAGGGAVALSVLVEDNGGPVRQSVVCNYVIDIVDANEAPIFAADRVLVTTLENAGFDSGLLAASDVDAGDPVLAYEVVSGNGAGLFELTAEGAGFRITKRDFFLDEATGLPTANPVTLNFELSSREWTLNVQASDDGPSARIGEVCNPATANACGAGAVCVTDQCAEVCFDTDLPRDASLVLRDEFLLCDYAGEAPLAAIGGVPAAFHREVAELTYVVSILDDNDAPAVSSCPRNFNLQKNLRLNDQDITAPGFLDAITDDEDADPANAFAPYTFALLGAEPYLSVQTGGAPAAQFIAYDGTTGGPALENEPLGATSTAVLRVTDTSGASSDCALTFTLIESNVVPVLADVVTAPVAEDFDLGSPSLVVLAGLFPVDPDAGETFNFTTSPNANFELDLTTGEISLGEAVPDFEALASTGHQFRMIVKVTDSKGAEDVATVSIPITDANEAPRFGSLPPAAVLESAPLGTELLGSLLASGLASDPDVFAVDPLWNQLTFSLDACLPVEAQPCPFAVDSATGAVTLTGALDFDAADATTVFDVTLRATDGEGLSGTGVLRVEVQNVNEAPRFVTVGENLVPVLEGDLDDNAVLFDMSAVVVDEDAADLPSTLVYTITEGNDLGVFRIETGQLKGNNFALDYEAEQEFLLRIVATDSGGLSANEQVRVQVINVNDVRLTSVVAAAAELDCDGGTLVTLTGANLGLVAAVAGTDIAVAYTSDSTGRTYQCADVTRTVSNTELTCRTVAGVGRGFSWVVTVVAVPGTTIAGDASPPFATTGMAFEAPVLTSVAGAAALPTAGGATVTLTGTCLGVAADFPLGFTASPLTSVEYCSGSSGACSSPVCAFSPSDVLECVTVPGVGSDLQWVATVGGLTSAGLPAGSFAPPTLDAGGISETVFPADGVLPVVFTGSNFGPLGSTPDGAFAQLVPGFDTSVSVDYGFTDCVVTTAFVEVTCSGIEPGVGADLAVALDFGGQATSSGDTVSFERPEVTSFSGEGVEAASTVGGQQIIVRGSGFGPACGRTATVDADDTFVACPVLSVTYSRGSPRASDGATIVYAAKCTVVTNEQMICVLAPGTGADHAWTFDIANHVVGFADQLTSYGVPTVGAYEGDGASDADTQGGQTVLIKGSNFGPVNGAVVVVKYGPEAEADEFTGVDCAVTTENEVVTCTTEAGAGDELQWTLFIDEQESRAELTDYGEPDIFGFLGAGVAALDPDGQTTVLVDGKNFGPALRQDYLDYVRYGPPSNPEAYEPFCVITDHFGLECTTVPGIGEDMAWKVSIKGQESVPSSVLASYQAPSISLAAPLLSGTEGGAVMRLSVAGVPLCDDNTELAVVFGDEGSVAVTNVFDLSQSSIVPIADLAAYCALPLAARGAKELEVAIPENAAQGQAKAVSLLLSSKLFDDTYASNAVDFEYGAPVLLNVFAEPLGTNGSTIEGIDDETSLCDGQLRVTLRGSNFCKSPACCQVQFSSGTFLVESHSHNLISGCTSDVGIVSVKCGDVSTAPLPFNARGPFVFATETSRGLPLSAFSYPTDVDSTVERITVWGLYFGTDVPTVKIGGEQVAVESHVPVQCSDASVPATNFGDISTLEETCWRTTVVVEDGQGRGNGITVAVAGGGTSSFANNDFEFVNYEAPSISSVTGPERHLTEGGSSVSITGANFGPLGEDSAVHLVQLTTFGSLVQDWVHVGTLNCTSWSHTQLDCDMPFNEGADRGLLVIVGNQDTAGQQGEHLVSYLPPQVDSTTVGSGAASTEGGDSITILGSNFGRVFDVACPSLTSLTCTPIRPVVSLGGLTCTLISNTQTEIVCEVPPGEGTDLTVAVTVRGQTTLTGDIFGYAEPSISGYSPTEATTAAQSGGNDEVMEIFGANFGVNLLSVEFLSADGERLFEPATQRPGNELDPYFEANATYIRLKIPAYRGADLLVVVTVAGQETIAAERFSYKKPAVTKVEIADQNGDFKEVTGGAAAGEVNDDFFPEYPGPDVRRRRALSQEWEREREGRALQALGSSALAAPNETDCSVSQTFRGFSWRVTAHDVDTSGGFSRSVSFFEDEFCGGASGVADLLFTLQMEGVFFRDKASEGDVACSKVFVQRLATVSFTPESQRGLLWLAGVGSNPDDEACCAGTTFALGTPSADVRTCLRTGGCPSLDDVPTLVSTDDLFGVYLTTDRTKLFMSEPVASSTALRALVAYSFPVNPSLEVVGGVAPEDEAAGPTSGCYDFEAFDEFRQRREDAIVATGSALNVFRRCEQKALMTLFGENFSTNLFNASQEIEIVFFNNDTGVEYRAATTSTAGDHPEPCSVPDGCEHDHLAVTFQIPPGSGRNMLIRIDVGGQSAVARNGSAADAEPIRFHYFAPSVSRASPGTLRGEALEFADANGGQRIDFRGDNFGGVQSNTTLLVDGRACLDAEWQSGDLNLATGLPFLTCTMARDVVGPRSLFVCVADQLTYLPVSTRDAPLLLEGDRLHQQGRDLEEAAVQNSVTALVNTRCKTSVSLAGTVSGAYGGMNQLCAVCPTGSVCAEEDAPFSPPRARASFFRVDVPTFEDDGVTVSERAGLRCARERWDAALLATFPALVLEDTCPDYVSCEPASACAANNVCAEGYQYAFNKCEAARAEPGFDNACAVQLNPFTGAFEGVDSDCNPNPGTACDPDSPEQCSSCEVRFDTNTSVASGVCVCEMPQRCALCSLDTHFRLNNECEECPKNPWLLLLGFVLVVVGAIVGGYYLNKRQINLALIAIGVDYAQVLAIFASANVQWPAFLQSFFNFLSFFNFNIDIAAPECIVPTLEFETKWWLMEALPLVILGALILIHLAYSTYKVFRWQKRTKLTSHVSRLVAIFLVIFYFLYLNVTKKALDVFNCNQLPVDDGFLYTSFTSLSCDGGSLCRCGEDGGIQQRLVPLAIVFLIIYSFGFPAGVLLAIRRNKDIIIEDQYLRAHQIGDSRETNPRAYDTRKRYGQLYQHFKPQKQAWIVLVIVRKFAIASSALFFRGNVTFQLSMILLVLFWSFVIQVMNRPYMSTGERPMVLRDLDEKAEKGLDFEEFTPYTKLQRKIQESVKVAKEIARKERGVRHTMSHNIFDESEATTKYVRRLDRQRQARLYFFDYNTVEAALLGSAIIVCLSGIMFESGRFDERPDLVAQRDALTIALIIVVMASFIYYALVFVVELFPMASLYTNCLQRRKPDDHENVDLDGDVDMQSNPMFLPGFVAAGASPADEQLRSELELNQQELDRIAEQNTSLRAELRRKKQDDQFADDDVSEERLAPPAPVRKQFTGK